MIRIFLISVLLTGCGIATDDSKQGSAANQAQPQTSRNTEVVDRLVANTPVTVMTQTANVCEINRNNNEQRFVACNLPGKQALHIEDVGTKKLSNGQPNPRYFPACAFWLEPTVARLFDAGEYFRKTMLSAEQLDKEGSFNGGNGAPELKRCQIPEFEAMKTLMISGFIAPSSQYTQLVSGSTAQEKALPPVKPSFLKSTSDIGRPSASAEELSAQYQIPHRISILNGPSWGGDNNSYPILMGAWDIGSVNSGLAKPVYEVVISLDGQLAVGETTANTAHLLNGELCHSGWLEATAKNFLPKYKEIKQPWIFFRLANHPDLTKARVRIVEEDQSETLKKEEIQTEATEEEEAQTEVIEGDTTANKVTTALIDLDNDGIDDLAVWDDGGSGVDLDYGRNRLIFANVGGQWYLLNKDDIHACGC